MVPRERLELSRPKTSASKTDVSTNFTIWAGMCFVLEMVGREGFEPPKAKLGDLQSPPFDHSGNCPKIKSYHTYY